MEADKPGRRRWRRTVLLISSLLWGSSVLGESQGGENGEKEKRPIHFGVVLNTFERAGDPNFRMMQINSLPSILDQEGLTEHCTWTLFLGGDGLSPHSVGRVYKALAEVGFPYERVVFANLPDSLREQYLAKVNPIPQEILKYGMETAEKSRGIKHYLGKNAINLALDVAMRDTSVTHIARLDDDDAWTPHHLSRLCSAYWAHDGALIAYSGTLGILAMTERVFPEAEALVGVEKFAGNFDISIHALPHPQNLGHSGISWAKGCPDIDRLRYRNVTEMWDDADARRILPLLDADADMWYQMQRAISSDTSRSLYLPYVGNIVTEGAAKKSAMSIIGAFDAGHWVPADSVESLCRQYNATRYSIVSIVQGLANHVGAKTYVEIGLITDTVSSSVLSNTPYTEIAFIMSPTYSCPDRWSAPAYRKDKLKPRKIIMWCEEVPWRVVDRQIDSEDTHGIDMLVLDGEHQSFHSFFNALFPLVIPGGIIVVLRPPATLDSMGKVLGQRFSIHLVHFFWHWPLDTGAGQMIILQRKNPLPLPLDSETIKEKGRYDDHEESCANCTTFTDATSQISSLSLRMQELRAGLIPVGCIQTMPWFYWKPNYVPFMVETPFNFGDELNVDLGSWIFGVPRRISHKPILDGSSLWTVANSNTGENKIISIGSIMHLVAPGDVVTGVGYYADFGFPDGLRSDRTIIHSIRGPVSCSLMMTQGLKCPEVQMDPAMFSQLFFWPNIRRQDPPEFSICVIPHFKDRVTINRALELEKEGKVKMIYIWEPLPRTLAEQVVNCGRVISSALHGLIIADAFLVPSVWLYASLDAFLDKFEDHFQSVGRRPGIKPVRSIEEGMTAEPMELVNLERVALTAEMWLRSLPFNRICGTASNPE